jgi:hypothetical protein
LDFFLILLNADLNDGDGDPQFWQDIRAAITEEDTKNLLEALMDVDDAPSPNDAEHGTVQQQHCAASTTHRNCVICRNCGIKFNQFQIFICRNISRFLLSLRL